MTSRLVMYGVDGSSDEDPDSNANGTMPEGVSGSCDSRVNSKQKLAASKECDSCDQRNTQSEDRGIREGSDKQGHHSSGHQREDRYADSSFRSASRTATNKADQGSRTDSRTDRSRAPRNRSRSRDRAQGALEGTYGYRRDHVHRGERNRSYRDRREEEYRDRRVRRENFQQQFSRTTTDELSKLPAYINPNNVNVTKVIEQQEKRKLLWRKGDDAAKEEEAVPVVDKGSSLWSNVAFAGDTDGAVANKFKKLMGVKSDATAAKSQDANAATSSDLPNPNKSQEELFRNLDRQYQMARLSAHTQRGVGLGFNSG